MKTINREKIERMVGRGTGGGGGGGRGVDLAGYATQGWVEQQYISKEFFLRLFSIHGHNAEDTSVDPEDIIIEPNDTDEDTTVLDSIEAKAGLWTNSFVSALGLNPDGGGTGGILSEPLLSINSAGLGRPTRPNVGIVWDGTRWVYGETGGGSTGMNPLTVKAGTNTTVIEYKGETAKTLTFDAVANSGITVSGDTLGTIKIGYTLPTASANTLGGVKVGNTLSISDGVLNLSTISNLVAGTYRSVTVDTYGRVTAGTNPTTLEGYGITDAKIVNGVITLGRNTITPLTDATIKSDYEWWGQKLDASGKVNGDISIRMSTFDLSKTDNGVETTIWPGFRVKDNANHNSFQAINAVSENGINSGRISVYNYNTSGTSVADKGMTISVAKNGDCSISIEGTTTIGGNLTLAATSGTYIKIGGLYLVYDQNNNAIKVSASPTGNTTANFYATGAVSALGIGDSGGGTSTFDESAMWTALAASGTGHKINNDHLSLGTLTINGETWNPATSGNKTINITSADGYITPIAAGQVNTAKGDGNVWFKRASNSDNTPTGGNGVVIEYGLSTNWVGRLFLADDGSNGMYWSGVSDGDVQTWKEFAFKSDNVASASKLSTERTITLSGDVSGSATFDGSADKTISVTIGSSKVTNAMLAGSIENSKLKNSSVTVNGTSVSLGGSINTANITAGTAGTSSATSGGTIDIPYVTVNKYGIVTGYGTHSHSVTRLSDTSTYSAWGQQYWSNGVPNNISGRLHMVSSDIYWKEDGFGDQFAIAPYFSGADDANLLQFQSAVGAQGATPELVTRMVITGKSGYVGIGTTNPSTTLHVNGYTRTNRLYLSNDIYLVVENGGVHVVGGGLYADTFVSALGKGDDGGASTFDESAMWNALKAAGTANKINNDHLNLYSLSIKTKSGTTSYNPATGAQTIDISNLTGDYLKLDGTNAMTGDMTFGSTGKGVKLKDSAGNSYFGLTDNGTNLWIGAQQTAAKHHVGLTHISAGYDQTASKGNPTIFVSVPNAGNTNATNYGVLHTGNYKDYIPSANSYHVQAGKAANNYIRIATITIPGTEFSVSGFSAMVMSTEVNEKNSFILNLSIRRGANTDAVTVDFTMMPIGTVKPRNCYVRSISRNTFYVYIEKVSGQYAPYYNMTPFNSYGDVTFEVSPVDGMDGGSVLSATAEMGGISANATKLETSRKINGTSFDGTADITTTKWGTAHNITIKDASRTHTGTAVSVDGSVDITLLLPSTIEASLTGDVTGNATTATTASKLSVKSKKAWGRTYWTSDGVPTTISGSMEDVGSIAMNGAISGATTISASSNVTIGGTLGVTGAATLSSTLSVSGNVGIGTTSPSAKLHVNGNCMIANPNGGLAIYAGVRSGEGFRLETIDGSGNWKSKGITVMQTGNIGIGNDTPGDYKLNVSGTVKATKYYLSDSVYFELTSDGVHLVNAGFYSDSFISALGANASGGSGSGIDANWLKTNDVEIKRLGIGVAPSSYYQLNVQGPSSFTGAVTINSALTVNSSVTVTGSISSLYSNISCAHDITAGGNGLIHSNLTVGQSSVNTSYNLYVNGTSCLNGYVGIGGYNDTYNLYVSGNAYVSSGIYLQSNVYISQYSPASGVSLCNIVAPSGLSVNGSTSWSSDMRKKDVVSYVNDLDVNKVAKAPVFRFTWKDKRDSVVRVGTSAQYWREIMPSSVMDMGEYGLTLDYNAITIASAVITARKVVDHELRVKQLEERIAELENEINELKAA